MKNENGDNEIDLKNQELQDHLNTLLEESPKHKKEEHFKHIPEEEYHLIEDFLDKFVFISDASISKD